MGARTPSKPKTNYEPAPAGTHIARLYRVALVGTVPTTFQGEEREADQIHLTFELCNERKVFQEGEEAKPISVSTRFLTFSMGKKSNLRKLIEGMSGVSMHDDEAYSFDVEQLLGDACLLTIVHNEGRDGNTYANIQGASPLMKGITAPELYNTARLIDVTTATLEEIEALPGFLKDKMKSSKEYAQRVGSQVELQDNVEGSSPF